MSWVADKWRQWRANAPERRTTRQYFRAMAAEAVARREYERLSALGLERAAGTQLQRYQEAVQCRQEAEYSLSQLHDARARWARIQELNRLWELPAHDEPRRT